MKTLPFRLAPLALLICTVPALAGPASPAAISVDVPDWRYTVRPGDTLIGVSSRYLARPSSWPRLQRHNRISQTRRLVPGSTLLIPLAWLRQEPAPATVIYVNGQVSVTLPEAAERGLSLNERVPAGAVLTSGANSSATLRFADGSVLVLQPGARLALDTVSVYAGGGMVDTRVRLQQGRVEIGANPNRKAGSRLQVITPSAVAAVRGTRFRVGADAGATREETLEGQVGLTALGRQVSVAAGQGSRAELGKPPSPPVALLPAPDVTGLPAKVEMLPMRFDLPALPGSVAWLGQIARDAGFETLLLEDTSTSPQLSFADLPDGRYVLRVRAEDAKGLQGHDAVHAFELDARPFAPLLTAPGARVRQAKPELQWSAVVGASAYQVQVARDAGFADAVLSERTANTKLALAQDLAPGNYFWRVASVEAAEQGPFAPPQRLTYDPLPGAPELNQSAPVFGKDALTLTMPTPPAGLQYELVLSRDAERKEIAWQGTCADGKMHASPLPPSTYYLSARLVEADGTAGPYATRVIAAPPRPLWHYLPLLLPLLAI